MPRSCPSEMKSDVPTSVWRCVETYTQKRPPTAVDPTVEPNVEPPPNAIGCVSRTGGLPEEPSEDGMYAMFHFLLTWLRSQTHCAGTQPGRSSATARRQDEPTCAPTNRLARRPTRHLHRCRPCEWHSRSR